MCLQCKIQDVKSTRYKIDHPFLKEKQIEHDWHSTSNPLFV